MRVVVDTNILFSFFRENPVRFVIVNQDELGLKLFTPEYAFDELMANKKDLFRYSSLNDKNLSLAFEALKSFIEAKPLQFFIEHKAEAAKISPDKKDDQFFALALRLNASIWSNEPRLKKQGFVSVFSTQDIRKYLGILK